MVPHSWSSFTVKMEKSNVCTLQGLATVGMGSPSTLSDAPLAPLFPCSTSFVLFGAFGPRPSVIDLLSYVASLEATRYVESGAGGEQEVLRTNYLEKHNNTDQLERACVLGELG